MTSLAHATFAAAGRAGRLRAVAAGLCLSLAVAERADAQLICGAAHTAPTVAGAVGQLVQNPGQGLAQLIVYHQNTADQFGTSGQTERLPLGGRAVITSGFLTGAVGLVRGADVWAQAVVHRFRIDGEAGASGTTGLGDVRFHLRASPELVGIQGVPISLRAGVKLPGSDFPVDPDRVPVTDGQVDWEVALQFGRAVGTLPLYLTGWAGYRWRQEDVDRARKPGNERFGYVGVGGPVGRLSWTVAVDGLSGTTPRANLGIPLETARRRLVQVVPSLGLALGQQGQVHVGSQIPLSGRNLPAGHAFTFGYLRTFGTP